MNDKTNKEYAPGIPFPYLPEGRTIQFVPEDNAYMQEACLERKNSTDTQFSTGAVAVKDGKVIGSAHNRAGYSLDILIRWHKKWMCTRRWLKVKTGTKYWICPGCATHCNHAESGLVIKFKKEGRLDELKDADIYLYGHWWCCKPCWDEMEEAGIKNVYVIEGAKEKFDNRK